MSSSIEKGPALTDPKRLLFTVPVTSNASRHFKSPLAMGEMPFKIKRASSVPISVVIDTGVNSNPKLSLPIPYYSYLSAKQPLFNPSKAAAPEALVPKNNISVDSKLGV